MGLRQPQTAGFELGDRLRSLVLNAANQDPIRVAVVHPVDKVSLAGALAAAANNLVTPVLVGPRAKIQAAADALGADIRGLELEDTPHSHAAAAKSVALVRQGKIQALMKGALHTDEIMGAIVEPNTGLRTERRISHIYVMDTPAYSKLLLITDAAINITPGLAAKRDIVQNAIDLSHALGTTNPKVAILSAMETVNPKFCSTIDAAALCKMADRGQITGGILDGPLAFDNAISAKAAQIKGLKSPVAGDADILVVPNLETGNMLAKQLDYLAGAVAAGIAIGARVPIILTSRAEETQARVAACALAKCIFYHRQGVLRG